MTNKIDLRLIFKWGFVIFVFYLLSTIKLHGYDRTPGPAHGEELLYSWSGINLIETGTPISWSTLNYPKKNLVFSGIVGDKNNLFMPADLWKPWLDEPPLYSLMSGGMGHIFGDDRMKVIPPSHSRIPSVFASLITMGLVFVVGYQFFSYWTGILAMIFYGLSPVLVFGSRLSVPENIIALGVIGGLILAKKYMDKPGAWFPIISGLMAAVLGLMKPTGFFMAPLMMYLAFSKKRWSDAVIILGITLLGGAAYAWYGYHYDWNLFMYIVGIQGRRFAGWSGLPYILNSPAYDIFLLFDGWYIFGLLSTLYFSLKRHKSQALTLMCLFLFYWLMIAVLSGTEQDLLPWYRYPMFPLISIFGALGLKLLYKRADFFATVLGVGLLLSSRFFLANAFRPTTPTMVFRVTFFLALVPSLVYLAWKYKWAKRLSRVVIVVFIILGLYFNAKYIYSVFEIQCESRSCPFGPTTKFSEVKLPVLWRFLVVKDSKDMLTTKRPWF